MRLRLRALCLISVLWSVNFLTTSSCAFATEAPSPATSKAAPAAVALSGDAGASASKKARARIHREKDYTNRIIASSQMPEFLPDSPESSYTRDRERMVSSFPRLDDPGLEKLPTIDFCSEWNPEFSFNGHRCCRSIASARGKKTRVSCFSKRPRGNYCEEMTEDQKQYIAALQNPKPPFDVLEAITQDMGRKDQAFCTANNGFLAHGRPIVSSQKNRIELRAAGRCTQFGTDNMVGMLEWLGRQVAARYSTPEYSGVRLVVGDVSAPRGGCLSGSSGRRGHLSHTNGSDVDLGLLTAQRNHRSPASFHNTLDAKENWWLIKQMLKNPYACVKVIFLDKRHIRKLAKAAAHDEEWRQFARYIRHQKGHRNHIHVRIGAHPGSAGCAPGADPGLEEEADLEDFDEVSGQMAHPVSSVIPGGESPGTVPEFDVED